MYLATNLSQPGQLVDKVVESVIHSIILADPRVEDVHALPTEGALASLNPKLSASSALIALDAVEGPLC